MKKANDNPQQYGQSHIKTLRCVHVNENNCLVTAMTFDCIRIKDKNTVRVYEYARYNIRSHRILFFYNRYLINRLW